MRLRLRNIAPALAFLLLGACVYDGPYGNHYDRGYSYYSYESDYDYGRDYHDDDDDYYEYERDHDEDGYHGHWIPPGHMKRGWD